MIPPGRGYIKKDMVRGGKKCHSDGYARLRRFSSARAGLSDTG